MTYVLGVDIGTWSTNAAIVRLDGDGAAATLGLGARQGAAASALFLSEGGRVLAGDAAEDAGRRRPERLLRGFTRRLGDTVPMAFGEMLLPPEELFAALARWVVTTVEAMEGAPAAAVALSHPRGWGGYRTSVARRALADAGLAHAFLLSEPEAAALHYSAGVTLEPGSLLAVCDLGGGIDATVLRRGAAAGPGTADFETLGRADSRHRDLGAELDGAVFAHVLATPGGPGGDVDTDDPRKLAALVRLRRDCAEAKEALSEAQETSIRVTLPGVREQVRITRAEFEALAGEPLREAAVVLGRALEAADVAAGDLAAVILTGGAARIPLAVRMLAEPSDGRVVVDADPASVTARGAALAAARHHRAGVGTQAVVASVLTVQGTEALQKPHDLGLLAPPRPSSVEAAGVLYLPVGRPRTPSGAATASAAPGA